MSQGDSGRHLERKPVGSDVLLLIVAPTAVVGLVVFFLSRFVRDGVDVLPWTLVGAGLAAGLIIFLRTSDRPDPRTLTKPGWRWGLTVLPVLAAASGYVTVEIVFLGFLGGFAALSAIVVGVGMVRDLVDRRP